MGSLYTLNFKFDDDQAEPRRPTSTASSKRQSQAGSYCAVRNDIENAVMFCKISSGEDSVDLHDCVSKACEAGNRRSMLGNIVLTDRNVRVQFTRPEYIERFMSSFKIGLEAAGFSTHTTESVCISQRRPLSTPMVLNAILVKILSNSEVCVVRGSKQVRTSATEDAVQQYDPSDITWQSLP